MTNKFLISLTKKYESPLYVYDAEKIISQYNRLSKAFSSVKNLKINYAAKALSNISVLKLFRSLNSGLDTVSVQEVQFHRLMRGDKVNAMTLFSEGHAEFGCHNPTAAICWITHYTYVHLLSVLLIYKSQFIQSLTTHRSFFSNYPDIMSQSSVVQANPSFRD